MALCPRVHSGELFFFCQEAIFSFLRCFGTWGIRLSLHLRPTFLCHCVCSFLPVAALISVCSIELIFSTFARK